MLSDFLITLDERINFDYDFDVWLHKVYNEPIFNDWREKIHFNGNARNVKMDVDEIKTTVKKSSDILDDFNPQ